MPEQPGIPCQRFEWHRPASFYSRQTGEYVCAACAQRDGSAVPLNG